MEAMRRFFAVALSIIAFTAAPLALAQDAQPSAERLKAAAEEVGLPRARYARGRRELSAGAERLASWGGEEGGERITLVRARAVEADRSNVGKAEARREADRTCFAIPGRGSC